MKKGLYEGFLHTMEITVTPKMFAQFEGNIVHPVYSTVSMVYHMELVSRQIILPFLENEEEGMGAEVTVKHIQPCKEGIVLSFKATVIKYDGKYIATRIEVFNKTQLVGEGEVKQVVLLKEKIKTIISSQ
ncbi:thioesterase family protein [Sutcliffiella cohnii]|uniref:Thioesterase n=1 Tax=Sutcliffiella cohnii TaxID=33932 RepID=A0A223KQU0_9BACI|nr:thioesterase [Sutcliffiella cohnii]AST91796.1 thioesterase [Sutcliffiella cohnii]